MPSKITKEDVALFVLVGGYCPKCKKSPQPRNIWGYYCLGCWSNSNIGSQGSRSSEFKQWNTAVNLLVPALDKWAKIE